MKLYTTFVMLGLLACGCDTSNQTTPNIDNSAINERDQRGSAKTPLDQNENQKDIDITASIRKQVMDGNLSVNAQNVKIITQNGSVTLRGPVANAQEKDKIDMIARKVAGDTKVNNQIDIANLK